MSISSTLVGGHTQGFDPGMFAERCAQGRHALRVGEAQFRSGGAQDLIFDERRGTQWRVMLKGELLPGYATKKQQVHCSIQLFRFVVAFL